MARAQQGRDRSVAVTRGIPVVGQLGVRDRHPTDLTASFQFEAERRVEAGPLALEELTVGDLSKQGVMEGVAATHRTGIHQHAVSDGRPQGLGDHRNCETEDLCEKLLVDAPSRGGGTPKDLPRPLRQRAESAG